MIVILVLLIFLIWNAALGFKPLHSAYLFVGDLIKKDWSIFGGYGFWLYCGLGGSGKTISMVEYLKRQHIKYPKLKIYTNFALDFADGQIDTWEDILYFENYELELIAYGDYCELDDYNRYRRGSRYYKKIHQGIIYGFDEIHLTFASQKWNSAPDNLMEYISQQRKLHKQIVASSQVFGRVDKKLREQTNYVIECSSVMWGRWVFNRFFHTPHYLINGDQKDAGTRKRRRAKRYSFVSTDCLRSHYNTYQVMLNLKAAKSDNDRFIDTAKKLFKHD